MSWPNSDQLHSLSEIWPEPLIIDLLSEHYEGLTDHHARIAVARRHAGILKALIEDASSCAGALRRDLIDFCGPFGISAGQIAAGERAVFIELARIVITRFRNSDRQRKALAVGLHTGVTRLAAMTGIGGGRSEPGFARMAEAIAA